MTDEYNAASIQPLRGCEAIRKRPSFYFDRSDPLLASKLVLQGLLYAVGATKAHIVLDPGGHATVSFNVAMSTERRHPKLPREAESQCSQLYVPGAIGTLNPNEPNPWFEGLMAQLAVVNAACTSFAVTINDEHGEWGQLWERSIPVTELELVGDVTGNATFIEMTLDPEMIRNVEFEGRFVAMWCGDQELPITVVWG